MGPSSVSSCRFIYVTCSLIHYLLNVLNMFQCLICATMVLGKYQDCFLGDNVSSCQQEKRSRAETYKAFSGLYFITSVELLNGCFQITLVFHRDISLELVSVVFIAGGELTSRAFLTCGWYVLTGAEDPVGFPKYLCCLYLILYSQKFIPLG